MEPFSGISSAGWYLTCFWKCAKFLFFLNHSEVHVMGNAGGRGVGLRMIGLGQGSLAPGIMGPGRPLMPLGIGNLAQGFGPFGAIAPHGRPQVRWR